MEVHHHPDVHHKRKNLKEYFLEFLMIFLAVTLGFIAENVRENISENSQAKELAKSLYKEIYSDSVTIQQKLEGRLEKENYIKYFVSYLHDSSLTHLSPRFYPAFTSAFVSTLTMIFEPKDGILSQLRNSGALRYFKSSKLQEEIGNISVAIAYVKSRNVEEGTFRDLKVWSFLIAHYDYKWFEELNRLQAKSLHSAFIEDWFKKLSLDSLPMPTIINRDQFNKVEASNIASEYLIIIRGTRILSYTEYVKMNHELLETLRNEYDLS